MTQICCSGQHDSDGILFSFFRGNAYFLVPFLFPLRHPPSNSQAVNRCASNDES